jgi:hypothetical protein
MDVARMANQPSGRIYMAGWHGIMKTSGSNISCQKTPLLLPMLSQCFEPALGAQNSH